MGNHEPKGDFLKECMTDPALVARSVPIDQFCQTYCVVCSYKPCVRSRANQMIFTERVANWRPRMFTQVPRAADDDENYAKIRAKNFQNVGEPLVVNFPSFPDPAPPTSDPTPEQPAGAPLHFTPMTPTEPAILEAPEPPPADPPAPKPAPVMTQTVAALQQEPTLNNTPFQGGIVLPGKPVDKQEDKFLEPGATFTFDEDDK
jgi:hypothetical protein